MATTTPTAPAPIITVWTHHDGSFGGISPVDHEEATRRLERDGHAIVTDSRYDRPSNHRIVGVGVGHDDALFCETRGRDSMAAYYENGDAFGGRWWETTSKVTRRYYYPEGEA